MILMVEIILSPQHVLMVLILDRFSMLINGYCYKMYFSWAAVDQGPEGSFLILMSCLTPSGSQPIISLSIIQLIARSCHCLWFSIVIWAILSNWVGRHCCAWKQPSRGRSLLSNVLMNVFLSWQHQRVIHHSSDRRWLPILPWRPYYHGGWRNSASDCTPLSVREVRDQIQTVRFLSVSWRKLSNANNFLSPLLHLSSFH